MIRSFPAAPSMPLPNPGSHPGRNKRGIIKLVDQIIQVVVRLEDDIAAPAAIAARGAALGTKRLAQKRHAAFAAVARPPINFYLVNKHQ